MKLEITYLAPTKTVIDIDDKYKDLLSNYHFNLPDELRSEIVKYGQKNDIVGMELPDDYLVMVCTEKEVVWEA